MMKYILFVSFLALSPFVHSETLRANSIICFEEKAIDALILSVMINEPLAILIAMKSPACLTFPAEVEFHVLQKSISKENVELNKYKAKISVNNTSITFWTIELFVDAT